MNDSRSEVETKIWVSKIVGSKLIFSLDDHEVESSSDSKEDEVGDEISQFSDDEEESLWILLLDGKNSSRLLMKKRTR